MSATLSRDYVKTTFGFYDLLTPDGYNPKTKKGRARGYSTAIMHFAPEKLSGYNVCQYATPGCKLACLNTAGHGGIKLDENGMNAVQLARIARTKTFFESRETFNALLVKTIGSHVRRARKNGLTPVVRLNGTSDLPWETLHIGPEGETILELFADIMFYDYTKNPHRAIANARGQHPANYKLTFSLAESNAQYATLVMAAGGNIAAVFAICDCKRPCKHEIADGALQHAGRPVLNGDADDLRHLDPDGVVVGLKAKGRAKQDTSGFVIDARRPAPVSIGPATLQLAA